MVSRRAAALTAHAPAIAAAHLRVERDPYDPQRNPGGYLNLGTAENRLVWDLLADKVTAARNIEPRDVRYGPLHGSPQLRAATSRLLSKTWHAKVDPDHLVVVSGASAALDIVASVLCDPGEAIVVAAPYYSALDVLLTGRSGARLIPAPLSGATGFSLDARAVERAIDQARKDGVTVRAVAITSPCNPTGNVHSLAALRDVLAVAERHDLDVIADEIYANSVFGDEPFVSVLDPRLRGGNRVHVIWGFAKDFGLSGLKVGVLHTEHPEVLEAATALAYFAPVSTDTQALLTNLLADHEWVDGFLKENRARLADSYRNAAACLAEQGIPHVRPGAGFTVWTDLSRWLGEGTENQLWHRVLDEARVNLIPGTAFGSPAPGWFRLCHTTDPGHVHEALRRVGGLS
ncbi:aminotransferase class I/II-fold pyridoxal phosphate-dependent enzyme [Kutzneria kofuensis]|nr:aminotransferase class I/II-fold pyridoxal phosphate-dependent enzyme [Kutzneria kofuensis]